MHFYNEIDEHAASTIENLIFVGAIPNGIVDRRSIEDILPSDLVGFTQCHFFAGIAGWQLALQLADWPADRQVWTGSCPCQPFSAAGEGAGFADERHLWPAFEHLIRECRPAAVFGEQVASKVAEPWLDLVRADLEALDYAFGGLAFPAASVGAPHIRDRTYWVGYASGARGKVGVSEAEGRHQGVSGVANHTSSERVGGGRRPETAGLETIGMADYNELRQQQVASAAVYDQQHHAQPRGSAVGVAHVDNQQRPNREPRVCDEHEEGRRIEGPATVAGLRGDLRACATNGHWRDADWVACRDGKWRPVEPGTFPLAHGVSNRVGLLRAYGNAIVPQQAAQFILACEEARELMF